MYKSKYSRILFALALMLCVLSLGATALRADTLSIQYNSGDERKVVVTGPLLSVEQERVFTESELKDYAYDRARGDLYYFTMKNTVLSKRAYTVRGVSLWDVLNDSGIPEYVYRGPGNYLHSVSTDGFLQVIGPGVEFSGVGGITETGTLDAPRYSYYEEGPFGEKMVTLDFIDEIDGGTRIELPWVMSFAESYNSVFDGPTGVVGYPFFPDEATSSDQALRPYFGQAFVDDQNLPLSSNWTYRFVFSDYQMSIEEARNVPSSAAFSINGVVYDRATIMTGFADSTRKITTGQKVKGSFSATGGGDTAIVGTLVESLINPGTVIIWDGSQWIQSQAYLIGPGEYASFENAAGVKAIASYEDIVAQNYTLVYSEDGAAIKRDIDGMYYYFDLYRDGGPVVKNISGIALVDPSQLGDLGDDSQEGSEADVSFEDDSNVFVTGSGVDLVFSIDKDFSLFQDIRVNEHVLIRDVYYKATEGSTKITLLAIYLDSLQPGDYAVLVGFADGAVVETTITVVATKEEAAAAIARSTGNPFIDIPASEWFYESVLYVYGKGLMTGTSTDPMLFSPAAPLTRGMVVAVLHRMEGSPVYGQSTNRPFDDVPMGQWYTDAVSWAAASGIVSGYGDGRFGPDDNITREQMAAILSNYQLYSKKQPEAINVGLRFDDRYTISDWALGSVDKLVAQGIIGGKPGNVFDPKGNTTRAEFASVLTRYMQALEA